ncbi:MAG: Gfo/Idh/MocA family oxidoreductase [Coriobacteriales bacterium]|jgi:oxidoreductase domain protein
MFLNSILLTSLTTFLAVIGSSCVAYVISKFKFRGSGLVYTAAVFIMIVPTIGSTPALYRLMENMGLKNNLVACAMIMGGCFGRYFMMMYGTFQSLSWTYAEAGYDLLLEKPNANTEEECEIICAAASRLGRKVIVCQVLRYTPFYRAVKRLLKEGAAGEIVTVEASENVGYYHQAHSFVRGLWRNSRESSPMILAKCCHDMDILRWLVGKKCEKVSSMGALTYFNESHAPAGSAAYCSQCSVKGCVYRAQDLYLKYRWMSGCFHVGEQTDEAILSSLGHSPYDRCVYR